MFAVEITTQAGPVVSRFFSTIKAARKWASWCAKTWPTRIMEGGQGGQQVF